jgi:hypothetical protein
VFGVLGLFVPYFVFRSFSIISLFFALIPAALGVSLGTLLVRGRDK